MYNLYVMRFFEVQVAQVFFQKDTQKKLRIRKKFY